MILSCHHIYKSFGTTEILKDISFHMEERQKITLIGANGAGKSTLLKIITGEYSADSGEAVLASIRIWLWNQRSTMGCYRPKLMCWS